MRWKRGAAPTVGIFVLIVALVVAGGGFLALVPGGPASSSSTSSTGQPVEGVVTGYVTVGPSQPVCSADLPCNVNMTGYSLVFTPECAPPADSCAVRMAPISPSGHYSELLPAGVYAVTGLYPSCGWLGCSSAFPRNVTIVGGMQLVFNVDIDTGIR
jgi:hypothetical protein